MHQWQILHKEKTALEEEILKIILANRKITGQKEIAAFLHPNLEELTVANAGLKKEELEKAAERIKKALKNRESIVVYTDYDVDGVCGGAIVWETLYELKANVMPYIPHRSGEGYGLSKKGIDRIKNEFNPQLIITVDHGISADEEINYAKTLGMETIVLDHHLKPAKIPKVAALIHTTSLCSGGIAWFFRQFLLKKNDDLDLAAMATVADLMPLTGLNRVIVKFGLEQLNKTKRLGLNALIKESGLEKGKIGVFEIGHVLAPRINAMGRLEHALDALRLICTKDESRALELSRKLSLTNRTRQEMMQQSSEHAIRLVSRETVGKLLFVVHETYNEGVIGLIAGKLVETYWRPAIVVSKGREYSKASARSIAGLNIVELIKEASDLLVNVGGHPMAAGFTVETKNLEKLRQRLTDITEAKLTEEKLVRVKKIDLELDFPQINKPLFKLIQQISPFGIGNPEPVFASCQADVINASQIGKDKKHLRLYLRQGNVLLSAIGFGMGENLSKLSPDKPVDIAYTIDLNNWNGKEKLQLKLKDIKIH